MNVCFSEEQGSQHQARARNTSKIIILNINSIKLLCHILYTHNYQHKAVYNSISSGLLLSLSR